METIVWSMNIIDTANIIAARAIHLVDDPVFAVLVSGAASLLMALLGCEVSARYRKREAESVS